MRNFRNNMFAIASITFITSATVVSAGDLGGKLGGLGNTVGSTVGGLGNTVGNTVSGVTKSVSTTASATVGTTSSLVSAKADSALVGGIHAQLDVLTPKQLVRLCVSGGGGKGCGTGTPAQVRKLIDARLNALTRNQLISLCVSAGGSCGIAHAVTTTPVQPPKTGNDGTTAGNTPLTCTKIMNNAGSYEASLVSLDLPLSFHPADFRDLACCMPCGAG